MVWTEKCSRERNACAQVAVQGGLDHDLIRARRLPDTIVSRFLWLPKEEKLSVSHRLDAVTATSRMPLHPKTEGTRAQLEISPSEEYSIGYSAPAW